MRLLTLLFFLPLTLLTGQSFDKSKMDSLFNLIEEHNKAMGSLSISHKGKEVYQRSIGYSNMENGVRNQALTRFRIGSLSKTFTAVLILQLAEEGALALDQPLAQFFPELPGSDQISIEDLLRHRSGLFNFTNAADYLSWSVNPHSRTDLLKKIKANGLVFEPGSHTEYANTNYVLLTWIAEDVSGKSYATLLQERIAAKLGLVHTYPGVGQPRAGEASSYYWTSTWSPATITDMSVPLGAGAVISNPYELNRFYRGLMTGQLVSDSSLVQMTTLVEGFGLGLIQFPYFDKYAFGHTGGIDGFQSVAAYFPEQDVAIAWTGNGHVIPMNDILLGALMIYFGDSYTLPEFKPAVVVDHSTLEGYTGMYSSPAFPLTIKITTEEGTLIGQATGQPAFPLEAEDERTFRYDAARLVLTFEPDGTMTLRQMGMEINFSKE